MTNERVVSAKPASVESADDGDVFFGSSLERSVEAAFRLASVILGPSGDPEDATQDAIERAWRSRGTLRDPLAFDAWFQRIVINSCRDRLRRAKFTRAIVAKDSNAIELADGGDLAREAAQRDELRSALDRLNADQRIAIALRYFMDLEVDEIARRTGTRPGTVKSRLHRGLEQLRGAWEK